MNSLSKAYCLGFMDAVDGMSDSKTIKKKSQKDALEPVSTQTIDISYLHYLIVFMKCNNNELDTLLYISFNLCCCFVTISCSLFNIICACLNWTLSYRQQGNKLTT